MSGRLEMPVPADRGSFEDQIEIGVGISKKEDQNGYWCNMGCEYRTNSLVETVDSSDADVFGLG